MKLTFCGGAGIVTGSCYLVETEDQKALVDCGMFQGRKEITRRNYEPFLFDPKEISYVFLTHAHIDHSGLIPKLAKEGFCGKVLATQPTIDLCGIMLKDCAELQVSDTRQENRRRQREGLPPREPLYTPEDTQSAMRLFKGLEYDKEYKFGEIIVRYREAGHILGSAIIELSAEGKNVVFSGDLGQWDAPIVRNPTLIGDADYLIIESTYGDRLHESASEKEKLFLKYIKETYKKGGKLMMPTFAVERTQELLYELKKLDEAGDLPDERVFLDSPLAIKATQVFNKHRAFFDEEVSGYDEPFDFDNLVPTPRLEDSIRINEYDKPCIIMAGNGMCTGGRIRHHLKHGLWDPKNTLLFVGYQAEGTLGRVILDGAEKVKMMGIEVVVKADVRSIDGFSAHADYKDLLRWCKGFVKKPKEAFLVHGEPDSAKSLKSKLESIGFKCHMPSLGECVRA